MKAVSARSYERPRSKVQLSKDERAALLKECFAHYGALAKTDPNALNRKLPKAAFEPILDHVGRLLLDEAKRAAESEGPIRTFLRENPLPPGRLERLLPDEFRAFCLVLNALKQWVSAESLATDRYVLGEARDDLRGALEHCLVSGSPLAGETIELHHTVRDGRPPIPLGKAGHALLEGQTSKPKAQKRAKPAR